MYGGRRRHRARHTPHTVGTCHFHRHHRQSVIARLQADAKDSPKKRLRQEMVRRKILNQSAVLVAVGSDGAATLKEIARHVEPRDPENVEARAARFYWSRLFTELTRDDQGFQAVGPLATSTGNAVGKPRLLPKCCHTHAQPTTGKSVGKPRLLPKCCHTHAQPTTGKSVGKPRRRNTNPQQTCEPTTRKSVGKPASQMRMEAEVCRHECDPAATVPNVCMRNGKAS